MKKSKNKTKKLASKKDIKYLTYLLVLIIVLLNIYLIVLVSKEPVKCKPCQLENRVILNFEIKEKIHFCGRENMGKKCLYFIMNESHYDKLVNEFFEEVAHKTGRDISKIKEENIIYQYNIIPPSRFAQIIIPESD